MPALQEVKEGSQVRNAVLVLHIVETREGVTLSSLMHMGHAFFYVMMPLCKSFTTWCMICTAVFVYCVSGLACIFKCRFSFSCGRCLHCALAHSVCHRWSHCFKRRSLIKHAHVIALPRVHFGGGGLCACNGLTL